MLEIGDTIVSLDLFTSQFCCDLKACHGSCCVYGSAGAPLYIEEEKTLEETWENYRVYMKPEGISAIESQGFAVLDQDGDLTTPLIDGEECAYSIEESGLTWCAIEKAWTLGETTYRKPISCHLYPIRLVQLKDRIGLQYHRWDVCRAAEVLGKSIGEPLFRTLKDSIISRFGQEYFDDLEDAYKLMKKEGVI